MFKDKVLRLSFVLLVAIFFLIFLKSLDYSVLKDLKISWPIVGFASLFGLVFRYWGVLVWRIILKDLGVVELPRFATLSSIYAKAWMGRYIPGSVALIAGKVYLASQLGISKSRLTASALLEGSMQILSITAVSMLLIALDPRLEVLSSELKMILAILGFVLLISLVPPIFNRIIGHLYKVIKKLEPSPELSINRRAVMHSFLLYIIGGVISGTSYFFITMSINPSSATVDNYLFMVGAFNLAGAIGMAAVFVPSGIGVRDGIQLILLSAIMPKEIALVVTVVSRLWSAGVDVLFFIINRSSQTNQHP